VTDRSTDNPAPLAPPAEAPEPQQPYPPPLWWTRRLLLGFVGLLVLLAVLRLAWGWHADRLIAAAVAQYRAAGEPATLEDLDSPGILHDGNAVTHLLRAMDAAQGNNSPSNSNEYFDSGFPPKWHELAQKAVEDHAAAMEHLHRARQAEVIDWHIEIRSPAMNSIVSPHLNPARSLANLVGDAGLYAHFTGDDHTAFERIEDVFFLARAVDEQPFLIAHSVARGIDALTLFPLQVIATSFRVADAAHPAEHTPTHPVDRAQVRRMIEYLLDEQPMRDGFARAYNTERPLVMDIADTTYGGLTLLRPMLRLDALRVLEATDLAVAAIQHPGWHEGQRTIPNLWMEDTAPREVLPHLFSVETRLTMRGQHTLAFRVIIQRRFVATALAVRLYHNDHGDYPPDLASLVPDYLPAVPIDPFHPDGQPIGYFIAAGGTRPMLYSIGDEGTLDPIDESEIPTRPMHGWHSQRSTIWEQQPSKQLRDLGPWEDPNPPPPPEPFDPDMNWFGWDEQEE
jgi:hypothetical protein